MLCPSCKKLLAPGVKFCPFCGAATVLKCGSCGTRVSPGRKFCAKCGAATKDATAPAAKPAKKPAAKPAKKPAKPAPSLRNTTLGAALMKSVDAHAKVISTKAEARTCGVQGHDWKGCKCQKCGELRDELHQFKAAPGHCTLECSVCGKTKRKHQFKRLPNSCSFKCGVCGVVVERHNLQPVPGRCLEQCLICGHLEELPHSYGDKRKCQHCGEKRPKQP